MSRKQKSKRKRNWQRKGYRSYKDYLLARGVESRTDALLAELEAKEADRERQKLEAEDREKYHALRLESLGT